MNRTVTLSVSPREMQALFDVVDTSALPRALRFRFADALDSANAEHKRRQERAKICAHERPGHWFCWLKGGHAGAHRYSRSRP